MRPWIVAAALLAGCGARATEARPAAELPAAAPLPPPLRTLSATDAFGDLVALARSNVDDAGRAPGERCLLGRAGDDRFELLGDLALSLRPLPDPAESLDAALAASPRAAGLLSLFGFAGRGPVLVAAFTPMPPPSSAGAVVVVLTASGAHVRGTGSVAPGTTRAPLASLGEAVRPMLEAGASPIVLAAEADVRLEALEDALLSLEPLGAPVALGVPLAPGIEPPRTLAAAGSTRAERADAPTCETPPSNASPDASALRAALAALGDRVRACRSGSTSADAARGGLVRLRVQAAADGHVHAACASSEAVVDAALLRCLEASAMALALPPASDDYAFELPLRLARDPSFDRAPLCEGRAPRSP